MNHQQNRTGADCADGDPAFLGVKRGIAHGQCVGIIKNKNSSLKSDAMLYEIAATLIGVPFESHGSLRNSG